MPRRLGRPPGDIGPQQTQRHPPTGTTDTPGVPVTNRRKAVPAPRLYGGHNRHARSLGRRGRTESECRLCSSSWSTSVGAVHYRTCRGPCWTRPRRTSLTWRGSREDCPARSSTAHLAVPTGLLQWRCASWSRSSSGRSPQAVGHDRGRRSTREAARCGPVHDRQGRLYRDAAYAKTWPDRVWAIEGANGTGRPLAQRLLEAGERVLDVPAKLAARARLFDTGHNGNTDALDAHSIAIVAARTSTLRVLKVDGDLEALRLLADRREALTRRRVQTVDRLQALLAELLPPVPAGGSCRPGLSVYARSGTARRRSSTPTSTRPWVGPGAFLPSPGAWPSC